MSPSRLVSVPALTRRLVPLVLGLLLSVAVASAQGAPPAPPFQAALLKPGTLDATFGSGGRVIADFGGRDFAEAVAVQPDGKVVVAGSTLGGATGGSAFLVARYHADGSLDEGFGAGGFVVTTFGSGSAFGRAVALQPDGRIVVAGETAVAFAAARYLPDGTLDPRFGTGGRVVTPFGPNVSAGADAVALQADGRIVLAGVGDEPPLGNSFFALVRYLPDGALDAGFGAGGRVTTAFGPEGNAYALAAAVQPDGKILAAGTAASDFALARYLPDGTLDAGFDGDGTLTSDAGVAAQDVAVRPDGRILVAGGTGRPDFALARFLPDGAPDPSFGEGGRVVTSFGGTSTARAVALRSDGRIVAAGTARGATDDFALAYYLPDGSLDEHFGTGGLVTTHFGGYEEAYGVALQPDGRAVAVGEHQDAATFDSDLALARYLGQPAVAVALRPVDPPVVIPAEGGAFAFAATLVNATDEPQTVQAWAAVTGPVGREPVAGPVTLTLPARGTATRTLTQRVPGAAPAGTYTYTVHVGAFPGAVLASDAFPFVKEGGAARLPAGAEPWFTSGWEDSAPAALATTAAVALGLDAYPNPFAATTTIRFAVGEAGPVRLAVYDLLGREVAVLVEGDVEAGAHTAVFDARGLAPGTYVYRLTASGNLQAGRVTLAR